MLISYLDIPRGGWITDPFTGSGVTGTTAREHGYSFFGIEAHPLIAELASLKLQQAPGDTAGLRKFGTTLIEEVSRKLQSPIDDLQLAEEPPLVTRSFTEDTLIQLLLLRDSIQARIDEPWAPYAKWALLGSLRDLAAVSVGWPYQRPGKERKAPYKDVLERFRQRLNFIAEDVLPDTTDSRHERQKALILSGDSRDASVWEKMPAPTAQACVASPPYLNNFDYADATRLEVYFWGIAQSWGQLVSNVRVDMMTATTQQSSRDAAANSLQQLMTISGTGVKIAELVNYLEQERKARPRGKEYDRVVPEYFQAMYQILTNVAAALEKDAPLVWLVGDSAPYGVYIDTPQIIAELAEAAGFRAEKDVVLRQRGKRWATNATRHQTALSERLILLRKT